EMLVFYSFIAVGAFAPKLFILQAAVRGHAGILETARELEHGMVEGVETGQRDELELVAESRQLSLKTGDGGIVEVFPPVKWRRAIVCHHFAGKLRVHSVRKFA